MRSGAAVIAVILAVMMSVSTAEAQPCPKGTLRIYASWPMQGVTHSVAIGLKSGLEMAIEEVGGNVAGYCLQLVHLDGDSPETTTWAPAIEARNAYTAVGDSEAVAYIGPYTSAASRISLPITNRASMAQIGPSATYAGLTRRGIGTADGEPWIYRPQALVNFFRLATPADVQAEAAARWAQRLGAKKAFILHDGEAYGRGIAAAFETSARKIGLTILANQLLDRTQPNYRTLLTKIRESGADVVYMGGRSETGAPALIKEMAEVGLVAPHVRFMGSDQLRDDAVLEGATCAAAMATEMRVTFAGVPRAKMKGTGLKTYETFVERFGEERSPWDIYAVEAGRVVVDGIRRAADDLERAKTLIEKREAVRKAIAATKGFDGHSGTWSFDRNGDVAYEADLEQTVSGFNVVKSDGAFGCSFEFDAPVGN